MNIQSEPLAISFKTVFGIWILSLILSLLMSLVSLSIIQLSVLLSEVGLIIPIFAFFRVKGLSIASIGLKDGGWLKSLLVGLVIGPLSYIAALAVGQMVMLLLPPPKFYIDALKSLTPKSLTDLIFWLMIVAVFVGPCEELLSRGFVQTNVERRFGSIQGLILASILFGLLHLDPWRSPGSVAVGFIIGYVYQKRGRSLWAPIGVHIGHDWLAFTIAYLYPL